MTLEERAGGVDVYHAPSREKWGGLMGSIEVVSPRSAFFSGGYNSLPYQVLAMGEDRERLLCSGYSQTLMELCIVTYWKFPLKSGKMKARWGGAPLIYPPKTRRNAIWRKYWSPKPSTRPDCRR